MQAELSACVLVARSPATRTGPGSGSRCRRTAGTRSRPRAPPPLPAAETPNPQPLEAPAPPPLALLRASDATATGDPRDPVIVSIVTLEYRLICLFLLRVLSMNERVRYRKSFKMLLWMRNDLVSREVDRMLSESY